MEKRWRKRKRVGNGYDMAFSGRTKWESEKRRFKHREQNRKRMGMNRLGKNANAKKKESHERYNAHTIS